MRASTTKNSPYIPSSPSMFVTDSRKISVSSNQWDFHNDNLMAKKIEKIIQLENKVCLILLLIVYSY